VSSCVVSRSSQTSASSTASRLARASGSARRFKVPAEDLRALAGPKTCGPWPGGGAARTRARAVRPSCKALELHRAGGITAHTASALRTLRLRAEEEPGMSAVSDASAARLGAATQRPRHASLSGAPTAELHREVAELRADRARAAEATAGHALPRSP
jgi:hypothetical protein